MYFSNFNEKITYSNHWGGELDVCGEGRVCKEDLDVFPVLRKNWRNEHWCLRLEKGITEVGAGFLEAFKNLAVLVIHYSVQSIEMTPALETLLRKNKVVIRGWYDSYGERFALENGLAFLHSDIMVGWADDEAHYTHTRLEIRFNDDGKPYAFYDDYCPGISAGNNGGGTYTQEIAEDFFVGQTLESFAKFKPRFSADILQNEDLKYFFETAGKRRKETQRT